MPPVPSDYAFYAGMLRFVARKTDPVDNRVRAMLVILAGAADELESRGGLSVPADRLELTARAFAGVAAFLQKQILPEVVSAANAAGERQVRWAIDSAMAAVNTLLSAAAAQPQPAAVEITPPPPPQP